ncbi:MAG: type IV pilus secretin PilQ [Nitrospirae bacterium]|nr:type IV pilus secretin PilQ [Nitrospirota bacterium]
MSRKRSFFLLALFLSAILSLNACATGKEVKDAKVDEREPVGSSNFIKDIEITNFGLKIVAKEKFDYALTRTSDPFKIMLELKNVDQGTFRDRIESGKEGVSEVSISSKMVTEKTRSNEQSNELVNEQANAPSAMPAKMTILVITLSSPYDVTHEMSGNTLSITLRAGSPAGNSAVSGDSGENKEAQSAASPDLDKVFEGQNMPATSPAEATRGTEGPKARLVTDVSFKREPEAVNVIIHGDGTMEPKVSTVNGSIVIDIPGVKLSATLPREIALPLKALRWEETTMGSASGAAGAGKGVRIVMELTKDTPYEVVAIMDTVIVSLAAPLSKETAVSRSIRERKPATEHISSTDTVNIKELPFDKEGQKAGEVTAGNSNGKYRPKDPSKGADSDRTMKTFHTPAEETSVRGTGEPVNAGSVSAANATLPASIERSDISLCGATVRCNIGHRLTLDFQSADIVAVFRVLAQESDCNVVVDPSVTGKVTMQVKDAYWKDILELIQRINNLGCEVTGNNIIRIALAKTIDDQKDRIQADKKRENETRNLQAESDRIRQESQKMIQKTFKLNYAKAEDVKATLDGSGVKGNETASITEKAGYIGAYENFANAGKTATGGAAGQGASASYRIGLNRLVSPNGIVNADSRLNQVIVKDFESNLKLIEDIIKDMDQPDKQVMIEARIVEVSKNFNDNLGINWGVYSKALDKTSAAGAAGGGGSVPVTGNTFLADIPTAVGSLSSGVALGLINAQRSLGLDVRLQAVEATGNGKIITSPKILTMNNQAATITQGLQVPYPQMNQQGIVSAAFLPITVSINVKPQVTANNSIIMDLNVTKSDLSGFTNIGGSQTPNTTTLSEVTKVLVRDGETLVLGGIFKSNRSYSESGTPMLKEVPILGWLFKSEQKTVTESEFFIFITPRVITRDYEREASE